MQNLGDFRLADTIYVFWSTVDSSGALATRTVNGTLSLYVNGSTTQITTGITDTEDFDGVAGLHLATIVPATAGLTEGSDVTLVLTGATVDGVAGVGGPVAHFSIRNRGIDVVARGALTAAGASTFTLPVGQRDNVKAGDAIYVLPGGTGFGFKIIEAYDPATGEGSVASAFDTTPAIGDMVEVYAVPTAEPLASSDFEDASLTSAKFADDFITSGKLDPSAVSAIQTGLPSASEVAAVQADVDTLLADVDDLQTRVPAALVGGKMDASVDDTGLTDAAAEKNADALLGRNIAGGSNVGRLVMDVFKRWRNKVSHSAVVAGASTMTVTEDDDTTAAWTAALTHSADIDAVTAVDPA